MLIMTFITTEVIAGRHKIMSFIVLTRSLPSSRNSSGAIHDRVPLPSNVVFEN